MQFLVYTFNIGINDVKIFIYTAYCSHLLIVGYFCSCIIVSTIKNHFH